MKSFYITTPLYYVNDQPHIGHAYSTILSDVFNRYHKFFGEETCFLTGTDEHGQKVQDAAEKRGLNPQDHCNDMVKNYKEIWNNLNITYDIFFRTTDAFHKKAVQDCLQQLFDKGEIYEASYEGWYSVSEEIFYTEKELVDGKSPTGREVTKISEKNYFFKMSKYQETLIQHIQSHPEFIQPESRRNEVLGFLRQPLADLCISRPKSRLKWGIEIPFDTDFVTYVWFDALLNYATGVGYQQSERSKEFEKWWQSTGAVHIIGKDIITTHAVYWTTMLMALGIKLPKTIFAHGWILNKDQGKMSKSIGDVVSPLAMKDLVGVDSFRYFLTRDIHFGNDAPFSKELLLGRVNNDLANNMGNLLSRTSNLIDKFFSGQLPATETKDEQGLHVKKLSLELAKLVQKDIEAFAPSHALEKIFNTLTEANKYLENKAPWKSAKEDPKAAAEVLVTALECLRICALLLQPVLPEKMDQLLTQISCKDRDFEAAQKWPGLKVGSSIVKGDPLFPRIQIPEAK